jgi:hypothetical protein
MSSKTDFKTVGDFLFQANKTFIIPNYQRGYKWAVKEKGKNKTGVEKLMDDLIKAFKNNKEQEYFLQGLTVSEESGKIVLIDGQQRTTTLYLVLWCLNKENIQSIDLVYDIRQQSKAFIHNLKDRDFDYKTFDEKDEYQDIYYFKKAIEQIDEKLIEVEDKSAFKAFLLEKITILYITIDPIKAPKTFTMMNGNKATMVQEELLKAEMLRKVSLPETNNKTSSISCEENLAELREAITQDWETNALRSRYAREWDKWLYWWNRQDVKDFFEVKNPMGLLLSYFYWNKQDGKKSDQNRKYTFDSFRNLLKENGRTEKQKTKLVFKELRDLQKSFEDIFSRPKIHNYLKMSLICSNSGEDKFNIINYFIGKKNDENLTDDYAKWRLIGATHLEITKPEKSNEKTKEEKAENTLNLLSGAFVYQDSYDFAARQLLRFNVEEDNKLFNGNGRKFDFNIYGFSKSLEHIHPKSKAYHEIETNNANGTVDKKYRDGNDKDLGKNFPKGVEWLNRDEMGENCSEHSFGNLVLLDKNENSKFNDKPFIQKKEIYFNVNEVFKSRNLLHTISAFAKSKWEIQDIQENQKNFIERFKKDYNVEPNNINNGKI